MTSVITGDIIGSRQQKSKHWVEDLKKILSPFGEMPAQWEIYRGDEFQVEVKNPEEALLTAILIKAHLRAIKSDARMSIGFGDKTHNAEKISESNGTAFINSGELFETLKKQKVTLALKTGDIVFDEKINLMLRLALTFMDNWLAQPAQFVAVAIENPGLSQEELGQKLGINQAAVSRRQKRAQFDLVMNLDRYFRTQIKELKS
ncbi:winged helix-turn-helix transcriptional regulator [Flavobacterium pectinovorum]|uniref:winged helix-turn-helix transcriptional regulator n=1 Tax=Flavobacterium pectinovorum TaxID=29533 RepID=UPI0026604A91|nr:winged helix-turn-helix transcriptional regulator [Flavobacterium pectinovorum]WKL48003.1 winged helix-turn-helix transcriptional regulator [Flavobacterium pectinovorum]